MLKHIKQTEAWNEKSIGAKGFTLVELLVVIVILGILAAVVVFAVGGITDRGKESACATDSRTIRTAVEAYRAQNDSGDNPLMPALVSAGFLSTPSTNYALTYPGGVLTLTPSAACS